MVTTVTVTGIVRAIDHVLSIVPFTPDGIEGRTDCVLHLQGSHLPPSGSRVVAKGRLEADTLNVDSWSSAHEDESAWSVQRSREGVAREVADETLDSVPAEWELISTGISTLYDGSRVAVVEIVRETDQVRTWLRSRLPGSVLIFPFIREVPANHECETT